MARARTLPLAGLAALGLVGTCLTLFGPSAEAAGGNLLSNAGFEAGTLSGWTCDAGTASVVTSPVHSGSYALQGVPSNSADAQCTQQVAVQPNTTYSLSAWVDGSYVYLGATGNGVTDPAIWTPGTGGAYQQLTASFTTGASTTSVTVYLHGWYAQPTYHADDVVLSGPGGGTPSPTSTTASSSPTPTPTPTPTPSSSTSTPPPGGGAAVHVAPYVDMGEWPTPSLATMANSGNLKSFTLAFVTAVGCKASWFNAYDPRSAWAGDQVAAIRAGGGDVKISFGGASGEELAQACTDTTSLFNEYQAVVKAYNLSYVDFDIEGAAVADTASIDRRSAALAMLQSADPGLKISLTLPVLPTGLDANGLGVVRSAISHGVNLDLVNVMAMDYYQNVDYGAAAQQAAQATHDQLASLLPGKSDAQLWGMVGVTPMLGQNDDGHVFDLTAAQNLVNFAKQKHLGMLSYWEEGRDANACNGSLSKCTNITQAPYAFSKIFAQYAG